MTAERIPPALLPALKNCQKSVFIISNGKFLLVGLLRVCVWMCTRMDVHLVCKYASLGGEHAGCVNVPISQFLRCPPVQGVVAAGLCWRLTEHGTCSGCDLEHRCAEE